MSLDAFQQSVFLQSLGWAIANSMWQGGILWIVYHLIISFNTNASAKFKNNSGTLFLFSAFLWFIKSFFNKFIYLQQSSNEVIEDSMAFFARFHSLTAGISLKSIIGFAVLSLPYLSFAYLLLLLIFSIKLINSYRNTQYIKRNGLNKAPAEWRLFAENVANHIGINKRIKIWFSRNIDVPATIGFLKPVILIPVASLNQLSTDQLEAIILHELSHIKRNDYLINLFMSLIETILFFNPFVVLLIKIIKKERENCCDDFVLQYQYDRHSYASALLSLEHCRNQHLRLAVNSTSGKKQLLSRIKRIMEVKSITQSFNYGQNLLALVLITGIIWSVAWLAPGRQSHFYNKISEKKVPDTKPAMIKEKENNFLRRRDKEPLTSLIRVKPEVIKKFTAPENFSETNSESKNNIPYQTKKNAFSTFNSDKEQQRDILTRIYENNRKAPVPESFQSNEPLFAFRDNVYLNQFPDFDFQFLEDLKVNININKLKADIQKQYLSLLKIDWDDIDKEINENLSKIEKAELEMTVSEKQKMDLIREIERYHENIQTKLQLRLQHSPKDIMTWNKKFTNVDSLINNNQGLFNWDEDRVLFKDIQDNVHFHTLPPPVIKKRLIAVPRPVTDYQLTSDKGSSNNYYAVKKINRSNVGMIKAECEDEAAVTNKKRVNSQRLKKHVPVAKNKKIVMDISGSRFEFKIEY